MESVYLGPFASLGWNGFSNQEIFSSLQKGESALTGVSSILGDGIANKVVGRIQWERFKQYSIKNKCVNQGPIEARFAYYTASELMNPFREKLVGDETGLYVGTMNNLYGLVGLRNGYRICVNDQFEYEESVFNSRIGTGFSYVHPMVPVYKIPNNVIANLALDFELTGENANFFSEDSSCSALHESYLKIKNSDLQRAISVTSNHLFMNYLDFLVLEIQNFMKKNPEFTDPQVSNLYYPSEFSVSFFLGSEKGFSSISEDPQARILSSIQFNWPGEYFQRSLSRNTLDKVVNKGLFQAGISFRDLDALVFDNIDTEKVQFQYFVSRKELEKTDTVLISPTLFTGYSLCAAGGSLVSIAMMIIRNSRVFSSYLPQAVPKKPLLSSSAEALDVKRIGVLSQGMNNSLYFLVLEKV